MNGITRISGRSLILQGLVLASTLAVSEAVSQSITVATTNGDWRPLVPRYVYTAVAVIGTVLASQTVLREPDVRGATQVQ